MKQGVYDISIDQYHNGPGISRSGIMEFRRTPKHYHHKYVLGNKGKESSDALNFGNAFHTHVLEGQTFFERFHVWQKVNGRKPASNTNAWDEIEKKAAGKTLLSEDDFHVIKEMSAAITNNKIANGMIEGGVFEKSLFWVDKDTGLLCKVRPDIWHNNFVADLKTTGNASYTEFQRSVYNFGYHIQCAMIHEAIYALKGINMMNFVFIACEKEEPYANAVYRLDENAVRKGIEIFKKTLFDIKQCIDENSWPSYSDAIIDLPAYAYNNNGDL